MVFYFYFSFTRLYIIYPNFANINTLYITYFTLIKLNIYYFLFNSIYKFTKPNDIEYNSK